MRILRRYGQRFRSFSCHSPPWLAAIGRSRKIAAKPKPPEVFFSLPEVRRVTDHEDFTGYTQAIKTVQIRARVSGYLDKVNFIEGAMVNEGDVLCEVDPRPYQAAYDSAVGQYHVNEADPQGSRKPTTPGRKAC